MSQEFDDVFEYLKQIKKRLKRFRNRAPIPFEFKVYPPAIEISYLEQGLKVVHEIPILYMKDAKEEVNRVRKYLREKVYPKMKKVELKFVEPDSKEILDLMEKKQIPIAEAFSLLSKKEVETIYIIDKIDIFRNKIVLLDEENKIEVYNTKIPVLVLLETLKDFPDFEDKWTIFEEKCKKEKL